MKKLLIVLLVLVVAFVGGAYLLPAQFEVSRSVVIAADRSEIHPPLADLRTWPEWSAWTKERDPEAEWSFEGGSGAGQVWQWTGPELGNGKLTLESVTPGDGVEYGIAFTDPDMEGEGVITIEPAGDGHAVTWISRGDLGNNPLFRWMGLMMDGMLGGDLETGLQGLKQRVEDGASAPAGADAETAPAATEPTDSENDTAADDADRGGQ